MKPETMLKLLGEKAHRYIYGIMERAAANEAVQSADCVEKVKSLLSEGKI